MENDRMLVGEKEALVIMVDGKFFISKMRDNRPMFAWSLAGAKMFLLHQDYEAIAIYLKKKGYVPVKKLVQLAL